MILVHLHHHHLVLRQRGIICEIDRNIVGFNVVTEECSELSNLLYALHHYDIIISVTCTQCDSCLCHVLLLYDIFVSKDTTTGDEDEPL